MGVLLWLIRERLLERTTAHYRSHPPLPPVLEFIQFDVLSSGLAFLLLESPEPLDWARLALTCQDTFGRVDVRVVWNADQTRTFLFRDGGPLFSSGRYSFVFHYLGDAHPGGGVVTAEGEVVDEPVELDVELL